MTKKTDRRCFLARGVVGAAGIGAAYSSIGENILLAAIQSGPAQPGQGQAQESKADAPSGSLPWD